MIGDPWLRWLQESAPSVPTSKIRAVSPLMTIVAAGLLGALLASAITAALMWQRPTEPSAIPSFELDDVQQMIDALIAGAVLVGAHDELLAHNKEAENLDVVRGTRIVNQELLDVVRDVRADGQAVAFNLDLASRRGKMRRHLGVRAVPLVAGTVFLLVDDRAYQLQLQASSRDFLSNATHELKTPVGALSLLAEATVGAADDPARVAHFASRMQTETARLVSLVGQIIMLSKLSGQDLALGQEPLSVASVVTESVESCQELAAARNITLTVTDLGNYSVTGDREQLVMAITNLIRNAIAYSDPQARVAVSARHVTDDGEAYVDIAVSDNGLGIAEDKQHRIFERFYRVDYARSRESGGTGLGLPIVKEIVERHGGTVSVWSKLDQGSTFTLHLPLASVPSS